MQSMARPPMQTTTVPGGTRLVAPTAIPRLKWASESLKRSGFIEPAQRVRTFQTGSRALLDLVEAFAGIPVKATVLPAAAPLASTYLAVSIMVSVP